MNSDYLFSLMKNLMLKKRNDMIEAAFYAKKREYLCFTNKKKSRFQISKYNFLVKIRI